MTWSAALPGAAVRIPRTAAGRRALYLALLVGGLFALALLGGQRAQAAEDAPTALSADLRTAVEGVTGSVAREPRAGEPQGRELRPVTEDTVPAVTERAVRPVGEAVGAVTEGLDEARGAVPPRESLPELPALPEPPALPELPQAPDAELPVLPGLPELPALPEQTLPVTAPAPVTSAPPGEADSAGPATGEAATATPHGVTPYDTTAPAHRTPAHRTSAHPHPHRADSTAPVPVRHAPAGVPGGALDHRATVDNGTPRHGDAHAVAAHHPAPPRLVPGAAAHVGADEIRDAYRDIPVSPA
ncbi:hypothetical protein ACWD1Z_02790 [Streptomyces sp. NPDC002784]